MTFRQAALAKQEQQSGQPQNGFEWTRWISENVIVSRRAMLVAFALLHASGGNDRFVSVRKISGDFGLDRSTVQGGINDLVTTGLIKPVGAGPNKTIKYRLVVPAESQEN